MFCNDISTGKLLLRIGSSGNDVDKLQQALRLIGYPISVNGKFDISTADAIKEYQQSHNLSVDGVVGKDTGSSLCSLGYLKDILQEPSQHTYPSQIAKITDTNAQTPPGNISLPGSNLFGSLSVSSIKNLPSWIWYGVIGALLIIMDGKK